MIFDRLRAAIWGVLEQDHEDLSDRSPVVKGGCARICDPDDIPEIYCDISCKRHGERYLGLETGVTYIVVKPWELDG